MKEKLYKLSHKPGVTREDILAAKRELVGRVRNETNEDVTRLARRQFVDERWDKADLQREELTVLRQVWVLPHLRYP